jgi:hypothetical protein
MARLDRAIHGMRWTRACSRVGGLDRPVKPGDDGKAGPDIAALWSKRAPQRLHLTMARLGRVASVLSWPGSTWLDRAIQRRAGGAGLPTRGTA